MSFDEIPENEIEGYPCDCGGSITKYDDDKWCCDSCNFTKKITTKHNKLLELTGEDYTTSDVPDLC